MASLYIENSAKWKNLASIDYFTQFVKAWIPFNAWYKIYYPNFKTDRQAIDEIKSTTNKFRNKFVSLLEGSSNESISFKNRISELHLELERTHIFNKNQRLSFESIAIQTNSQTKNSFKRNTLIYKVERNIPNRTKQIDICIINKNGIKKFNYIQLNGFDLEDLINNVDYLKLNNTQKQNLRFCYQEINPSKPINLLTHNDSDCITMGNIHFINNTEQLCKGIIEILYKLRNVLFHGEIIPDPNTNKVYEPAYHILYTLIQAL